MQTLLLWRTLLTSTETPVTFRRASKKDTFQTSILTMQSHPASAPSQGRIKILLPLRSKKRVNVSDICISMKAIKFTYHIPAPLPDKLVAIFQNLEEAPTPSPYRPAPRPRLLMSSICPFSPSSITEPSSPSIQTSVRNSQFVSSAKDVQDKKDALRKAAHLQSRLDDLQEMLDDLQKVTSKENEELRRERDLARSETESARLETETARSEAESARLETETARAEAESLRGFMRAEARRLILAGRQI